MGGSTKEQRSWAKRDELSSVMCVGTLTAAWTKKLAREDHEPDQDSLGGRSEKNVEKIERAKNQLLSRTSAVSRRFTNGVGHCLSLASYKLSVSC